MSQELARRFFDEFVTAFAAFDGALVAQRYLSPYLACSGPGALRVFVSGEEIGTYFQGILDDYRARGCRSCCYRDLEVVALGADCALASVTWELLDASGAVVTHWRESYNLCRVDGRFRVFASTDHA
ncbi:MAG: hypothetical protein LPK18_04810 [Pseudomonadaceae bacterium]|nr:hypothetical protein [Pseudomonadaceae bacterium]